MKHELSEVEIKPGKKLTLKDYMRETGMEIQTRLRVAINQTDGKAVQDLLIDALDRWEAIDKIFEAHNREVKGPDVNPELKQALKGIIKKQLQRFRVLSG